MEVNLLGFASYGCVECESVDNEGGEGRRDVDIRTFGQVLDVEKGNKKWLSYRKGAAW